MREGDLKLEKMAALIPTKTARREVDRFFAQKRKEHETTKKGKTTKGNTAAKSAKKNNDDSNGADQLKLF